MGTSELLISPAEDEYLNWLLTPESERVPSTKKAMAEQLGVSETTLQNWPKSILFQGEYERRWRALKGGPERVKAAVDHLYETAMAGQAAANVTAMKLWLEWARELKKDEGPSAEPVDLRDMTDDELGANLFALQRAHT